MIGKLGHESKRGVVIIWATLLMMALIAFVGIGIDMGLVTLAANQLQACADAAALAGARAVRANQDQARQDAMDVALANHVIRQPILLDRNADNAEAGDIVVGRYDRTDGSFNSASASPNAVKVVARRGGVGALNAPLALAFGPIFGVKTVNVERRAIAMVGGGTGAGMISLSEDDPQALYIRGSTTVHVNGGGIQVNSNASNAVDLQGNKLTVDAPEIDIVGGIDLGGGNIGDTSINTGESLVPDPLRDIPEPSLDGLTDFKDAGQISSGIVTLSPGYYSGGLVLSGGCSVTLNPGIYVLGTTQNNGQALSIAAGTTVTGDGVMFYIDSGSVNIQGGTIRLTAPKLNPLSFSGAEPYEGMLIFQARDNDANSTINGNSGMDLTGTLYFPKNHVYLSGACDKLGTQFIADTIEIGGNADLTINYDGQLVAPGNRIFLVH